MADRRRPPPPTQQHTSPRGGLNSLLIIGVLATLIFVALRLLTSNLDQTIDLSNPFSGATILSYFAILTFIATPSTLWYAMFKSAIHRTGWDHAFFIGTLSLYMYFEMMMAFGAIVITSFLSPTHKLIDVTAITGNSLILGVFWILIFAPPAIFMSGPIIDAAHAEKHGMGASGGFGYVGFAMALAAATYVFFKVQPASSNIFGLFVALIAASMVAVSAIAILIYGRQYRDPITWMVVSGVAVAAVLVISSIFGL